MLSEGLELAGAFLVDKLKEELTQQGHRATGELIDSINYKVDGGVLYVQTPKDYVKAMENGLPKGHKVPISALIRWIEVKGIASGDVEVKQAAWAIRAAIIREGSPTKGAFKYTSNSRRTGFAEVVIDQYTKKVLLIIQQQIGKSIRNIISNEVKYINSIN